MFAKVGVLSLEIINLFENLIKATDPLPRKKQEGSLPAIWTICMHFQGVRGVPEGHPLFPAYP